VVSTAIIVARETVPGFVLPHGVLAMEGLFALAGLWGVRAATRMLDETHARSEAVPAKGAALRALLVGAGRDGRIACEELRARPAAGYDVVGFIDDAAERQGQRIAGVPVLGTIDDERRVTSTDVEHDMDSASQAALQSLSAAEIEALNREIESRPAIAKLVPVVPRIAALRAQMEEEPLTADDEAAIAVALRGVFESLRPIRKGT
jgi:FlaA1/EpsC-like NDP-sugar epimerase